MAVVASNLHPLREAIGGGTEPGWLIRAKTPDNGAAGNLGGELGTARLISIFSVGVELTPCVVTVHHHHPVDRSGVREWYGRGTEKSVEASIVVHHRASDHQTGNRTVPAKVEARHAARDGARDLSALRLNAV